MKNKFIAKTSPVETICEHTNNLKFNYDLLKELYPDISGLDWDILLLSVLYHDLGKMNTKFQNKLYRKLQYDLLPDLNKNEPEIPHGNLSVAFLDKNELAKSFTKDQLSILFQSIYFHHARYIDKTDISYLQQVIEEDLVKYIEDFYCPLITKPIILSTGFLRYIVKRIDSWNGPFYSYILNKGLLNRLDYAASAHIKIEIENKDLFQKTCKYLEKWNMRQVQKHMIENQGENNVIIASTGIGKTEASLLWIGNNKGFFTLPLKVSINAIYERIKNKIAFSDVTLLHSDSLSYFAQKEKEEYEDFFGIYQKSKQLSYPLTVTTVDQLFRFVFKYDGYESILATLAYSRIIIDEIQMYDPQLVAYILVGLKYITEIGGKFSIVTATLPDVFNYFLKRLNIQYIRGEFLVDFIRHKIKVIDNEIDIDKIEIESRHKKVLVIVNTVKKAQELFQQLNVSNKNLLHSRFIKKDRKELESKILNFTEYEENKEPGVWVTTQIVEASLDIDFDILFTELSTLDGLFQRMGRVYRKRKLINNESNVWVYLKASGVGNKSVIDKEIFDLSSEIIKKYDDKVVLEQDKMEMIKVLYAFENIKNTKYFKKIESTIQDILNIKDYELDKNFVENNFRNIQSEAVIPIVVLNNNLDFIDSKKEHIKKIDIRLRSKDINESARVKLKKEKILALDKLNQFTLDIPYYRSKKSNEWYTVNQFTKFKISSYRYSAKLGLIYEKDSSNIF